MTFLELQRRIAAFRDERNWGVFHNPKDLAISVAIEAGELLELFQWDSAPTLALEAITEEAADVVIYCANLADVAGFDLGEAVADKLAKNARRYPVRE